MTHFLGLALLACLVAKVEGERRPPGIRASRVDDADTFTKPA